MTSFKDSNEGDETATPKANNTPNHGGTDSRSSSDDALWAQFEREHADDLNDISSSRSAKSFERHARRQQRKDEKIRNKAEPHSTGPRNKAEPHSTGPRNTAPQGAGPRDFTGSSWLDVDDVMDSFDDFTPPNPTIGPVPAAKLVFWTLLIVGIAGLIATVFFPAHAATLGTVFGLCALIGAVGLLIQHRGFTQTRSGADDDGARV